MSVHPDSSDVTTSLHLGAHPTAADIIFPASVTDSSRPFRLDDGFRALFDSSLIGRAFVDLDGRILIANRTLADLLGYEQSELERRPLVEIFAPEDRHAAFGEPTPLSANGPLASGMRGHCLHRDGHQIPIRAYRASVLGPDGSVSCWVSTVVDLSDEEDVRRQLQHAHREALASTERLYLLHAVATAANDADTIDDMIGNVLAATCSRFGWASSALVEWQRGSMRTLHEHGSSSRLRFLDIPEPVSTAPSLERYGSATIAVAPLADLPVTGSASPTLALVFDTTRIGAARHAPSWAPSPQDQPPDGTRSAVVDGAPLHVLSLIAGECARVVERERAATSVLQNEARFRAVFDASPFAMGMAIEDTGVFHSVNGALCDLLGRRRDELIGASIKQFTHPDDRDKADPAGAAAAMAPGSPFTFEMKLVHASGRVLFTRITLTWVDSAPGTRLLLGQFEDVTAAKEAQAALQLQAETDSLTGLANRFGLVRLLGDLGDDVTDCSVVFVDLDGFRAINDSLGPHVGDEVLVEVADRLRSTGGPDILVARFGGDEFVVVCTPSSRLRNLRRLATGLGIPQSTARHLAYLIETALVAPISTSCGPVHVTASIGIAEGVSHASTAVDLLRHADAAMLEAKGLGKNRRVVYDTRLHQKSVAYRDTEALLRNALDERRFVVYYQPLVEVRTGRIVGFEALVRLRNKEGQLLQPGSFIGVAERSGLIVPMGAWVLAEACRTIAALGKRVGRQLTVSVNVAARQAARTDLMDSVLSALDRAPMLASSLTLELTESSLLDARGATLVQLTTLRDLGVQIALDDFGTGYSSLTYLRQFPVSHVKVDRTFVSHMTRDSHNAAIVRAVTQLATDLGLHWVAEGVETEEQWHALRQIGPGFAQGFLFARPTPADQLEHLFAAPEAPSSRTGTNDLLLVRRDDRPGDS